MPAAFLMIELKDFYNAGAGWICRQCDRELTVSAHLGSHSRAFTEGEAESRRFVRMRDAIYARLGSPASGSSRRSGPCVGEERARAIVLEELARHDYEGWSVTTAGEGFTADRPCAEVSFDEPTTVYCSRNPPNCTEAFARPVMTSRPT